MKVFFSILGLLVVILALTWLTQGNSFFLYKVFAPEYANVQRQVFENTDSYKRGMIQNLNNWRVKFIESDSAGREGIASVILHEVAEFPIDSLPNNLRNFIDSLQKERGY